LLLRQLPTASGRAALRDRFSLAHEMGHTLSQFCDFYEEARRARAAPRSEAETGWRFVVSRDVILFCCLTLRQYIYSVGLIQASFNIHFISRKKESLLLLLQTDSNQSTFGATVRTEIRVGYEPKIPVILRMQALHASGRAATAIDGGGGGPQTVKLSLCPRNTPSRPIGLFPVR
jgi:hypothetical protein